MAVTYSQNGVIVKPTGFDVIGGKKYKTVHMPDGKIWMAENLDFKFCNVGGSGRPTTANAWYYNNDETTYGWNGYKCGLLYNWYAAKFLNDYRNDLCPGWHVSTKDEWDTLVTACGGVSVAGTKLKALDSAAGNNWPSGWNGTDDYGFNALPAGYYGGNQMVFEGINTDADFITLTSIDSTNNYDYYINVSGGVGNFTDAKASCCSIRLVRDT